MPRVTLRSTTKLASQPYPVDFIRSDQFSFILKAAPYYLEAKAHSQLPVFLDSFFELYFTLWPDNLIPENLVFGTTDFDAYHTRHQKIREVRPPATFPFRSADPIS